MDLDLNLDDALQAPSTPPEATQHPRRPDSPPRPAMPDHLLQRLGFAAWPQSRLHPSWLAALAQACGLPALTVGTVAGDPGARSLAEALWQEAGLSLAQAYQPVPVDRLPAWALAPAAALHRHVSAAHALNLLPEMRLAVRGDAIRHWDALLGPTLRRDTLRWCHVNLASSMPSHATMLRRHAQAATRHPDDWQAFCLATVLTALAELGPGVEARMRLAWPHALRQVAPLPLDGASARWLNTCLHMAGVMLAEIDAAHAEPQSATAS